MTLYFRFGNYTGETRRLTLVSYDGDGNLVYQTDDLILPVGPTTTTAYLYRDQYLTSTTGLFLSVRSTNSPQPSSWAGEEPLLFSLEGREIASGGQGDRQVTVLLYVDPGKIYFRTQNQGIPDYSGQTLDLGVSTSSAYYVYGGMRAPYTSTSNPISSDKNPAVLQLALTPGTLVWGQTTPVPGITQYPCPPILSPGYRWTAPGSNQVSGPGLYVGSRVYQVPGVADE